MIVADMIVKFEEINSNEKHPEEVQSKKPTLLIVHKNDQRILILEKIFKNIYDIQIIEDSESAVAAINNGSFDLALIDTSIGDAATSSLCRNLNNGINLSTIPVIVTANSPTTQQEELLLSLGVLDYLPTSVTPQVLFNRVRNNMEIMIQRNKLELESNTDSLTGLANKRFFLRKLDEEWTRSLRSENALSVLIIDIDNFKHYNDQFGHLEGDKCITKIASAIAVAKRRSNDIVCRFGGEEFTVLLPYTDAEGATKIARRIVEEVRQKNIEHSSCAVHPIVTVSIGVATHDPSIDNCIKTSQTELIESADKMLYKAKGAGKNRFC